MSARVKIESCQRKDTSMYYIDDCICVALETLSRSFGDSFYRAKMIDNVDRSSQTSSLAEEEITRVV